MINYGNIDYFMKTCDLSSDNVSGYVNSSKRSLQANLNIWRLPYWFKVGFLPKMLRILSMRGETNKCTRGEIDGNESLK